jgi:hypothetical protein
VLAASDIRGTGSGARGGKSISSDALVSIAASSERMRKSSEGRKRVVTTAETRAK